MTIALELPTDFDDYEWEVTAKGWFAGGTLSIYGKVYRPEFYDPARLAQEVQDGLDRRKIFFEPNLIVVKSVTKQEMQRAIEFLANSNQIQDLVPE